MSSWVFTISTAKLSVIMMYIYCIKGPICYLLYAHENEMHMY